MEEFFGSEEALRCFEKSEAIDEKIRQLWTLPNVQELLKATVTEDGGGKSEAESKRWREAGNKHFQAGRDREAVSRFNKAVAAAPQKQGQGRDLSLAFANRSAALLKLGFPKLCLEDVEEAIKAGYPSELTYKIMDRRLRCLLMLESSKTDLSDAHQDFVESLQDCQLDNAKKKKLEEDLAALMSKGSENVGHSSSSGETKAEEIPKLEERHPQLEALSSAVTIKYDPIRGRFGEANRDIPVGSLILVEKPFVSCLDVEREETHCSHCLVGCPLRQVPCPRCSRARYCSSRCLEEAAIYHKYECGVKDAMIAVLGALKMRRREYYRTCYRAIAQIPLTELLSKREAIEEVSGLLGSQGGDPLEPGSILTAFSLVGHRSNMSEREKTVLVLSAVFQLRNLQLLGYFSSRKTKVALKLSEEEVFVGKLLYTLFEKMQWNTHSVVEDDVDKPRDSLEENSIVQFENSLSSVGNGLFPTYALLNSSCDNNVSKYFVGPVMIAQASKHIRAGEEVTDNYFPPAMVMPREERRDWLSSHYMFHCCCNACTIDQPNMKFNYDEM